MTGPRHLLFTPGPLTTSPGVRAAMGRDVGSREAEFVGIVRAVREELLALGGVSQAAGFEAILLPGSGTYGVEAVVSSVVPPTGKLLIVANGAYGERIVQIAARLRIDTRVLRVPETEPADPAAVDRALGEDPAISTVAVVHGETTTGLLNPMAEIGRVVRRHGRVFIVDAMSSFGALPIDLVADGVDFLVSSANKCLQGVPGFCFVLARRAALLAAEGRARSLSLDLLAQWRGLEGNGQFRFTPPTHSVLAFAEALRELRAEGGIPARGARYRANHNTLLRGMEALGFQAVLPSERRGPVIATFHLPTVPGFGFEEFYTRLAERGMIIYPGKLARMDSFRIGTIGHLFPADMERLLAAIRDVLAEMGVVVPLAGA